VIPAPLVIHVILQLNLEHHKHNLKPRWTQVIPAPLVIHVMLQLITQTSSDMENVLDTSICK
jgi:hypothetical protein